MALGSHIIVDLENCDKALLNDATFIEQLLKDAVVVAGATELNTYVHSFNPQGITGATVLAESHITIHTFPELGVACLDAFTCGDHTKPQAAIDHMAKALKGTMNEITGLTRGKDFKFLTEEERNAIVYD